MWKCRLPKWRPFCPGGGGVGVGGGGGGGGGGVWGWGGGGVCGGGGGGVGGGGDKINSVNESKTTDGVKHNAVIKISHNNC